MRVNSHNTFDRLQEVILGSVDTDILDSIEDNNKRYILEEIINDTIEDLNAIQKQLEDFNVTVLRPQTSGINFSKTCSTPFFDVPGHRLPLTPRDLLFSYQDTIITTFQADQNRYFESLPYNNILQRYMDCDSHVISMPMPTLHDSIYENQNNIPDYGYYDNSFPMGSAANFTKYGKDILYSAYTTINKCALRWFKRQLGEYRFHEMPAAVKGHIDAHINIVKPGVVVSNFPKSRLPDFFKSWTVITDQNMIQNQEHRVLPELISDNIQDDDFEDTVLGLNIFSIDQEHAMVYDDTELTLLKQLEKCNITPVPVKFTHTHFLNQGFTCITLDTVRQGSLEDYVN